MFINAQLLEKYCCKILALSSSPNQKQGAAWQRLATYFFVYTQPGSQASIEVSCKIKAFGQAYLVHYSILLHSRGGYFNSYILQAFELLPGRAKALTTMKPIIKAQKNLLLQPIRCKVQQLPQFLAAANDRQNAQISLMSTFFLPMHAEYN